MLRYLQLLATGTLLAALGPVSCDFSDDRPLAVPPSSAAGFAPAGGIFEGSAGGAAVACGGAGTFGATPEPSPQLTAALVQAETPPPPISGGTLLATTDGAKLVAADPDRDQLYVVDVATRTLDRRIPLRAGDQPGRLVEDAAGRIHVALRNGHGIATFALNSTAEPRFSEICDLPRGIAYDAAHAHLYVACAEGKLVRVDPATGAAQLKVELGRDLRDVVVHDGQLFVTRFRAAELIQLDPQSGKIISTRKLPSSSETDTAASAAARSSCVQMGFPEPRAVQFDPSVMWRAIDVPGRGVAMLHQRSENAEIRTTPGGYGGGFTCGPGIVRSAMTFDNPGFAGATVDLNASGLFVDLAIDPTGTMVALANPAGWGTAASVEVFDRPEADTTGQNPSASTWSMTPCAPAVRSLPADGQVTSVAWTPQGGLAALTREPAAIVFYDVSTTLVIPPPTPQTLDLQQPSRNDSGHAMFHATAGAGIACASCHPEAGDDGHTWTFAGIGARRTQNLRGGILGTEPFHWNGDMRDFPRLVDEVFVKRMNGPQPDPERASLLAHWIDRQPALRATAPDALAVERGKTLFESDELGCTKCHTGEHFTNNRSEFVGTGALLQVPSLLGVSFRAPFLHDGCAKTLAERFSTCGGGESHGHTAHLSDPEQTDLTAYLESL